MKSAAVYIRVSTGDQTEYSPDSQLKEVRAYAERHDMVIDPDHVFVEAGISGKRADRRPEFQRMIAMAKGSDHPFSAILVWKFSRFARNQEESILYKSLLRRECGVEVISITEDTGDSVFGSLIERIIEWMDEFYSIRLGEEVRAKMAYVAGKGVVQTTPPFGYAKRPGEPMQIVPDEARWVQYAADQFLQGKGVLTIANELNARGIRTHRGNPFENRTIEYMLHNPIYAGFTRWTPTGPTVGRRVYDSPDTIIARGDFDPIYPEETYQAILAEFERRERLRPKYARPDHVKKHWLSGFLKCGACGASMVFAAGNNGFQCQKYAHGLCSVSHFITAPKIEAAVLDELCRMKITKKIIRASLRPVGNVIDNSAEITRLSHMLDRAKFAYMQGVDTLEDYSRIKKKIDAEIAVLRDEEERSKVLPPEPTVPEVEGRIAYLAALLQRPATTDDERRDALGEIVEKITFSRPGNVVRIFLRL